MVSDVRSPGVPVWTGPQRLALKTLHSRVQLSLDLHHDLPVHMILAVYEKVPFRKDHSPYFQEQQVYKHPCMIKGGHFTSVPEILGCCLHWSCKVRWNDALEVPVASYVLNPPPRLHHSASTWRPVCVTFPVVDMQ